MLIAHAVLNQAPPYRTRTTMTTIWVNEQIDPCGILYSCIACCDRQQADECHESFKRSLTPEQVDQGWITRMRAVHSWDDVPVAALKLSF